MAITGLIEDSRGWRQVTKPSPTTQSGGLLSTLFGAFGKTGQTETINRADLLDDDIRVQADALVAGVKSIITSDVVRQGKLGDSSEVTVGLMSYLYRRLDAMRETDQAVVELEALRSARTPHSTAVIAELDNTVANNFAATVVEPTQQIVSLAEKVSLLDLQLRAPQLRASEVDGRNDMLTSVEAQLGTLIDFPGLVV